MQLISSHYCVSVNMKISEILDKTRSWELLRGNNIDAIFNEIQEAYMKLFISLETASTLIDFLGNDQWKNVKELLMNDKKEVDMLVTNTLDSLSKHTNDDDWVNKINSINELQNKFEIMINKLP